MNENMYGFKVATTPTEILAMNPPQKGDEIRYSGVWHDAGTYGLYGSNGTPVRRPLILPSDTEWQLVGLEEMPKNGDEIFDAGDNDWRASSWSGINNVNACVRNAGGRILAIRRRKQKPVSGWVSVKERLPESGKCVAVAIDGQQYERCYFSRITGWHWVTTHHSVVGDLSHWYDAPPIPAPPLPTPPTPELSASEKASEASGKWYLSEANNAVDDMCERVMKQSYEAGYLAALSKGTP